MDKNASPLKEWLGPVWDDWKAYEIHNWKRYVAQTVNVPCNWKIILDNFNESYHLPTVHAPERAVTKRRMPSGCLLYTSPSPRDATLSRMPSSA